MANSVQADLRRLALTAQDVACYICNGHGGWEAATSNIFSRGETALLLLNGQFGLFWADAMRRQGIDVATLEGGRCRAAEPQSLVEVLQNDTRQAIKAVCVTHVDTSTSVRNDIHAIREAIDEANHPALLVVDAIASLGCDELRMDEWGIDVLIAASQKGLMLPPGLAFLWFSKKARDVSDRADMVTPYWDWKPRADGEFYLRFGGTPPTQHIFGLRESLNMILHEEGLSGVWARHETLASAVWAAFEAWGSIPSISLNVKEANDRAHAVTTARIADGNATRLRNFLEEQSGVTLGFGLGMAPPGSPAFDDHLRVAHMGYVNTHMTLGVVAAMDAGMKTLGIRHGAGAVEAAGAVIASRFAKGR